MIVLRVHRSIAFLSVPCNALSLECYFDGNNGTPTPCFVCLDLLSLSLSGPFFSLCPFLVISCLFVFLSVPVGFIFIFIIFDIYARQIYN